MKKVVAIGGGTGLSALLRGLRDYPLDITAIVTMTDDGASTGILRRDQNILPPGDIRKCVASLSVDETMLVDLLQYRFRNGVGLKGHSLGNLLIAALKDMTGSFEGAVEAISNLLSVKGQVLPASYDNVHLQAEFADGKKILGESKITQYGYHHKIKKIELTKRVKANPKAIKAIGEADLIILGPGSLYTSLIPNVLIDGIQRAVFSSEALKIFICNISTERGETEGFSVRDHLRELEKYKVSVDYTLVNSTQFKEGSGDGFVFPVRIDVSEDIIPVDVASSENFLYHDSIKLGREIWKVLGNIKRYKKTNFIKS